ncbi:beta-lactamase domain-containing protein [Paraglaciecola mesophila KMM 241]|uniref:Beta-lactamase domain-containing protein n=1 Tax=Paraglaciecola mesophila KMM 241 TaxID=1128912 RepID=K6XV62_9ALTE|nr:MBL fold metallo-hydrolase [Paraglaciecola mesophila]GAC24509.1 beta-lactamase domain-containing protein [Paraglaciecola mesophila KMM 241]
MFKSKVNALRYAMATLSIFGATTLSAADDRFADVQISTQAVNGSTYMLTGAGGNIGVSAGDDGILIIDDQFAPLADKIALAIGDIAKQPMKYVINTHYHGDHTGSNAYFKEVQGSTIFAHDNVRKRLAAEDGHKHAALPVVTYEKGLTFHFNGDTIKVVHLPAGHTDSDSVVWFEQANVLHAGDLFFQGRFPYIDLAGGGTVDGYIRNVSTVIGMINNDTRVMPGHGELADKKAYQASLEMMQQTANYVSDRKAKGASLDSIIEEGLDEKWQDWAWNFITEEKWITTLYNGQ